MDQIIIDSKIDSILRCVQRIKSRLPDQKEAFLRDLDAQDVVVLNISRCVQMAVDIAMHICSESNEKLPQTMGQSFDTLLIMGALNEELSSKMKKSVGFRNIAVHNYDEIDLELAFEIAAQHIDDFIDFIKSIKAWL